MHIPAKKSYPSLEDINRDKLMDAAVACIQEYSLNKITMQHIAEKSGIVRQTVYNYYGNKNALLAAAFEREGINMAQQVAYAVKGINNVEEKFIAGFLFVLENFPENPVLAKVLEPGSEFLSTVGMTHYPFSTFGLLAFHDVFTANPQLQRHSEEICELWTRNALSFLTMPGPEQKSTAEMADYVKRRLIPGLGL